MNPARRLWPAALAALFAASFTALLLWRASRSSADTTGAVVPAVAAEPPRKPAPSFDLVDQRDARVTTDSLRGQVWIADFFFTKCTAICPALTARFVVLQRRLSAPDLRFVSFSVDPANDSAEVLAQYAREWNPAETRWTLLATDEGALARVARGFDVWVAPTGDAKDPIMHTGRFFLVDRDGLIHASYNSEDDQALERLVEDATALTSAWDHESLLALDAPGLFNALGCAGCHLHRELAPPLDGLASREVELEGGTKRIADARYLRESIVDPGAAVVAGYRSTMPNYGRVLDETLTERLVAYIGSLQPPASEPAAHPQEAVDPVCKMTITVFDDSPSMEYGGRRYFFCCEHCMEPFAKEPTKFVAP